MDKMNILYYPDKKSVEEARRNNDPLLMLVANSGVEVLVAGIDHSFEHIILLKSLNYPETAIDCFYRIVVNDEGADWTFVCPEKYKNIKNREKRIETFRNEGIDAITQALKLFGYPPIINVPARYRR